MRSPYENFLLWMRTRPGQKAEVRYQASARSTFQSRYITDALYSQPAVPALSRPHDEPKEEGPQLGEDFKAKVEAEYQKLLCDVWKNQDQLAVLTVPDAN